MALNRRASVRLQLLTAMAFLGYFAPFALAAVPGGIEVTCDVDRLAFDDATFGATTATFRLWSDEVAGTQIGPDYIVPLAEIVPFKRQTYVLYGLSRRRALRLNAVIGSDANPVVLPGDGIAWLDVTVGLQTFTCDFSTQVQQARRRLHSVAFAASTGTSAVDMISVKSAPYLAVGDGMADDTAAIQSACDDAFDLAVPCYFPAGTYKISSAIVFNFVHGRGHVVKGDGPDSIIFTTSNISMFQLITDAQPPPTVPQSLFNSFTGLRFRGNVPGTRMSNVGIEIGPNGGVPYVSYSTFEDLTFEGVYYGIRVTKANSGQGGELHFDWNRFANIHTTNSGSYQTDNAIAFEHGSGTGNVFANLNLVVGQYGLRFNGGNGENIGDIVITGAHVGSSSQMPGVPSGTGVYVASSSNGTYRGNISVTSSQFDAGLAKSLDLNGVHNVTVQNISYGGGTTSTITSAVDNPDPRNHVNGSNIAVSEYGIRKGGLGVAPNNGAYLFSVQPTHWGGVMVEITTSGLAQNVGAGVTTTRYQLTRDGGDTVTVSAPLSNNQFGAGQFTHGVDSTNSSGFAPILGSKYFFVTQNGTIPNSWANSVIRVVGDVREVRLCPNIFCNCPAPPAACPP